MSFFYDRYSYLKISLESIKSATNNFADENLIRQGGFGKIYRGKLVLKSEEESIDIVARRFHPRFGLAIKHFRTEIVKLDSLKHQNLVSIVGYCDEDDEKIIINRVEAKGSLDKYLSDPTTLTWTKRLKICVGIAHALSHIHYDKQRDFSVIHRNVKSSKILLDNNWEAKLSGFELSVKQAASQKLDPLLVRSVSGTYGYVDPSYATSGRVTHKTDVYSFGVVLFEVLCGKRNMEGDEAPKLNIRAPSFMKPIETDSNEGLEEEEVVEGRSSREGSRRIYKLGETYKNTTSYLNFLEVEDKGSSLAELARSHYEKKTLDHIILPGLRGQMDSKSLQKFSEAAYFCLKEQQSERPTIEMLLFALKKALELQLAHDAEHSKSTNKWKREELEHLKIDLDVIKSATENFDDKYLIGAGGYGSVYRATLEHFDSSVTKGNKESDFSKKQSTVAIKKIYSRKDTQDEQGFIAEVETLGKCKHPNIVSLLGFCYEHDHKILVYEYVPNGSLEDYLNEGQMTTILNWEQRIQICIDIAYGLDYIHTTMEQYIIHRDIKSANILLGENLEAKIADFGLSKVQKIDLMSKTLKTQTIAGTEVYLDPEYQRTGKLKKESDIYSFGVVLIEILSGRLAYDQIYIEQNERGVAPIAREHFENETLNEMVDPRITEESGHSTFTLSKGPNPKSLCIFSKIAYQCLAKTQADRPKMKAIITELKKALQFQKSHKDSLRISFEDIRIATQNFNPGNIIGHGRSGVVYRGEIFHANGPTPVAVKRWKWAEDEPEFERCLLILSKYKHKNIIGLVGYCYENGEKIIVYEYASNRSLDMHLNDASLTWPQRLKIGIDVATGLDFLGLIQDTVIHKDITPSNILLTADWKAKITNYESPIPTRINNRISFLANDFLGAGGIFGYYDPVYYSTDDLTRKSDMYSLGVVLCELMCGKTASSIMFDKAYSLLGHLVKLSEEGKLDTLVFPGIKERSMPKSLTAFQITVIQCLAIKRDDRPTAREVVSQLKKALEFQEDYEVWMPKLPTDYNEILVMSKAPEKHSDVSNKDLFDMFSKGIFLQDGKVFSLNSNGKGNEMVSARMFSYGNSTAHTWRSIKTSRFQKVMKVMDISNLKIQIKIKTQFLSPNVIYGAHLVFKFCEPRTPSSHPVYAKLKYKMGSKTFNTYFAAWRDDEWMMIELSRFIPKKKDVDFEVLLESLSRNYCGSGGIYIEGVDFQAIDNAALRMISNSDFMQQVSIDYSDVTPLDHRMKSYSC